MGGEGRMRASLRDKRRYQWNARWRLLERHVLTIRGEGKESNIKKENGKKTVGFRGQVIDMQIYVRKHNNSTNHNQTYTTSARTSSY